jgi:hypothetical protein
MKAEEQHTFEFDSSTKALQEDQPRGGGAARRRHRREAQISLMPSQIRIGRCRAKRTPVEPVAQGRQSGECQADAANVMPMHDAASPALRGPATIGQRRARAVTPKPVGDVSGTIWPRQQAPARWQAATTKVEIGLPGRIMR